MIENLRVILQTELEFLPDQSTVWLECWYYRR